GMACSTTLARTGQIGVSVFASAWCAMVMAILLIVSALAVGFAFMPHMQSVLSAPYASSGMIDPSAFVTRHLVGSASSHLFIAPTVAFVVGGLSAGVFRIVAPLGRGAAVVWAAAAVLLLAAGAVAIRHASSIERSKRPPFIQFGLASLAITLVSV